jgi:hypothetical protein
MGEDPLSTHTYLPDCAIVALPPVVHWFPMLIIFVSFYPCNSLSNYFYIFNIFTVVYIYKKSTINHI